MKSGSKIQQIGNETGSAPSIVRVDISSKTYTDFPESQQHLMYECEQNEDLKIGRDIFRNPRDCVAFFNDLLKRRQNPDQLI